MNFNKKGGHNVIDGEIGFIEKFEFNMNSVLNTLLFAPFTATIDRVAGTGSVAVPAFNAKKGVATIK